MKSIVFSILGVMAACASLSSAEVTLVGGSTLNGDFNQPGTAGNVSFATEPYWENIGSGDQEATFLADNPSSSLDGTHYAQLSEQWGMVPGLDTGHSIADGDTFSISYQWHDGWNWDGTDQVKVRLFVTHNDLITGTQTTLVSVLSGTSTANDSYELVDQNEIYAASASDAGKNLFVAIEVQGGETLDSYGQVDNFELTFATGIPSDSDSDGLPDVWEIAQFGDLTTSEGGLDNYDGDRNTDRVEYLAGTSATNALDYFQTDLTTDGAGSIEVTFDGITDRTYILETIENLSSNVWDYGNHIGPLLADGPQTLSHTVPGDPDSLFGRIQITLDPFTPPGSESAIYVPSGYSFIWGDNFSSSEIDTDKWVVGSLRDPVSGDLVPGADSDHQLNSKYDCYFNAEDCYTDTIDTTDNGSLVLRNRKGNMGGEPYSSGWVMSMHRGYFNKGYVEVRAKFPSGDKVWPAIWLIAEDLAWGPEWDLWEYFGYRSDIGYDNMGMHLMTGPWNDVKWNSAWIKPFDGTYDCETWHVYGFEWTADYAKWWIDGNLVRTLNKSASKDPDAWPNEEMYIVLNNGTKTASPDSATPWPNQLVIDYIEVYQYQ